MFVFDEIYVGGVKHIEYHIWVGNVWEIIPKYQPRVLEEVPKLLDKVVPSRPQMTE